MYGLGETAVLSNDVSRTNHYPSPYFETYVLCQNVGINNIQIKIDKIGKIEGEMPKN